MEEKPMNKNTITREQEEEVLSNIIYKILTRLEQKRGQNPKTEGN